MHSQNMLGYLPTYEKKSRIFQEHLNAAGIELDQRDACIEDFKNQLSVDTATWGLIFYENDLGIEIDLSKPYGERRSVVKASSRGFGKVDAFLIKLVADAFINGGVAVDFVGKIKVIFNDIKGIPPNVNDVYKAIDDIKPAHLGIEYIFTWLTWNEFDAYNKTWDEWDELDLTWDEFETYREVI